MSPVSVISPQLTFPQYHQSTEKHNKIAGTVSSNHMGQIQSPWAAMSFMTQFHHSQFHSPILVEVGQILRHTFSNVSKNHDPSSLQVQKGNRMKYDTQTKMVSYDLAHTR